MASSRLTSRGSGRRLDNTGYAARLGADAAALCEPEAVSDSDDYPAGWLTQFRRGVGWGIGVLLMAVGLCALPSFAVWFTPGTETAPALSAVRAAALIALSGLHGGMVLNGSHTTLSPLLVTLLLGWLVATYGRRTESWSAFAGMVTGFTVAAGLIARWSGIGSTHAPALASMVAALLFALLIGGAARTAGQTWQRLSGRWHRVLRATGGVLACYVLAGALLAAAAVGSHLPDAIALQRHAAPGAAGLPVALLGVGAAPNAVLAAIGYLLGPGFQVGSHTSVSVVSVSHGTLPFFPLLAGLPSGAPATAPGVVLVLALALLAGWVTLRFVGSGGSLMRRLTDCAAAAALSAVVLAVLSVLAGGGLGDGSLRAVGPVWWAVGLSCLLAVLFGSGSWLAVDVARGESVLTPLAAVHSFARAGTRRAREESGAGSGSESGSASDGARNAS